ncbi:MerR family transcriptional regulator [Actinosynnema sp. NPDC020468]|uniref:MerR family transcriptional regulator n=1 Tax=Actinosynnema sp. NPDC020468 TaxID=3154488 RepID=UPI003410D472
MTRWTIGELAQAAGITVRTLHHYDAIGLLRPGERTPAGHRRYTPDDVRRLYRIRALSHLGMPLDRVADALADTSGLHRLLTAQLADLDARARRVAELRARVADLLTDPDPEPERLLAALEAQSLLDAHLSADQRDALTDRRAALGSRVEDLRREWLDLLRELDRRERAGVPAAESADLAARWNAVGDAFHVTEDTKVAAVDLWRTHGAHTDPRLETALGWPAGRVATLISYLDRARNP